MNLLILYLLLLKATITSFSGLSSLPVVHADFVERRHLLTERELNTAVAAGRSGPGPIGVYVVNVGYLTAGVPGAIAGWLAMITPAFLVIPLIRFFAQKAGNPRVRGAIRGLLLGSAGLLISSTISLGKVSIVGPAAAAIAAASCAILAFTRVDTVYVIGAAAVLGALLALV